MAKDLPLGDGPGVGTVQIPEVDEAAATYVKFRDRRMDLTTKEVDAKQKLIDLLHKNEKKIGKGPDGGIRYKYEQVIVMLLPTDEKLTVKAIPEPDEE